MLFKPRPFPVCRGCVTPKRSPSRGHFMWWSEQGQLPGPLQLFPYKQMHGTGMVRLRGVEVGGDEDLV